MIIHAENQAVREKHLDIMERNMEFSRSIAESFKIMAEKMYSSTSISEPDVGTH